jgi:hypothetical protein
VCDLAGAAGLKSDATFKLRTTRRTWRDTAARDNQIEDDVEDVERYWDVVSDGGCGGRRAPPTPAPCHTPPPTTC